MEWFRMYSEFATDAKVQIMPEAMQRRLMMLFCLRCSNALVTLQETEIAFALRISNEDMAETKALFMKKGFINEDWEILSWDKRQFVSDSSAMRVAKHRAIKKEVEIQEEIPCNVTVTPQIQNRTDTEQIQNIKTKPSAMPQALPEWLPQDAWNGFVAMRKSIKKSLTPDAIPIAVRKLESLRKAGNDPRAVLEQSTMNCWQGLFEIKQDQARATSAKPTKFDPTAYVNRDRNPTHERTIALDPSGEPVWEVVPANSSAQG